MGRKREPLCRGVPRSLCACNIHRAMTDKSIKEVRVHYEKYMISILPSMVVSMQDGRKQSHSDMVYLVNYFVLYRVLREAVE